MKKFIVMFMAPTAVLASWAQKDEAERKAAEAKMMSDWDAWIASHKDSILEIAGLGTNTRVTSQGSAEMKNDIMLYALVQADSKDTVTEMLKGHVHLQIPEAYIEVMGANALPSKN
jgi:hypothetical protein